MMSKMRILAGGKNIRDKLNRTDREIYAVESEVSDKLTYIERDGEFAICYGRITVMMSKDVWQELAEILNERNLIKYGVRPS